MAHGVRLSVMNCESGNKNITNSTNKHMKKLIKISIFIFVFGMFGLNLFAKNVSPETAKTVAINFYKEKVGSAITDNNLISETFTITNNKMPVYYIFNIGNDKGFVIVSAVDNVSPVIGFSLKGKYSENDHPADFDDWMYNYEQQIVDANKNQIAATTEIKNMWADYSSSNYNSQASSKVLATPSHLLTTTWGVGQYYNSQCPVAAAGPGGHVYAGNVAVAMAQIMKYYKYPEVLIEPPITTHNIKTYVDPVSTCSAGSEPSYGTISNDFAHNLNYGWASMPNSLTADNANVARAIFHCGISVETNYSYICGSAAAPANVANAFINYFKYYLSANLIFKASYSDLDWQNLMIAEINATRPIFYSANNGITSFVCDGYSVSGSSTYFYFNWGQNGSYNDVAFLLSTLNPGGINITAGQRAVIGIMPKPSMTGPDIMVCSNINPSFSVPAVTGATYSWSIPTGFTGSSTSNTIYLTTPTSGTGSKSISVTVTKNGISQTFSKTFDLIEPISGPNLVATSTFSTFSLTSVTGATYSWTSPANFMGGTNTTNSFNMFSPASGSGSQTVSVTITKNGYSKTLSKTFDLTGPLTGPDFIAYSNTSSPPFSIPAVTGATYSWSIPSGFTGASTTNTLNVLAPPSGAGSMTASVTVTKNGTSVTLSKTFDLVSQITGPSEFCLGSSSYFTITNVTNATYAWAIPTGFVLEGNMGNQIKVQAPSTGSGQQSISVTITKNGKSTQLFKYFTLKGSPFNYIPTLSSLCSNNFPYHQDNATVTNVASTTYSWNFSTYDNYGYSTPGLTMTNPTNPFTSLVTAVHDGRYRVYVDVSSSCGSYVFGNDLTVSTCSGSKEKSMLTPMTISNYPNPASGKFTMNLSNNGSSECYVKLYNMFGKQVVDMKKTLQENENTLDIDVSKLANGIYLIEVVNGDEKVVDKIVVSH